MNNEKKKVINSHFLIPIATTVILALLILVTNTTVLSLFGGTINAPEPTTDGNISEGGADGNESPLSRITDFIGASTMAGRFIEDVYALSKDELCSVSIPAGTTGLTRDFKPLTQIIISPNTIPPEPPANSSFIGAAYNISPEGSTFYPTITVSLTYDPDKLPAGVKEKDLAIVTYNRVMKRWDKLTNINIDTATHIIRGQAEQFATFSIIAYLN